MVGEAPAPRWLDTDWLLGQFGGERIQAIGAYRQFVLAGRGAPSPLNQVRHQMLLGDDAFVVLHQQSRGRNTLREVSKAQRRSVALNLAVYRGRYPDRAEAMARGYLSGAMAEIGAHFGVHYMTVSRAVKAFEQKTMTSPPEMTGICWIVRTDPELTPDRVPKLLYAQAQHGELVLG